ncbi:hypothetical protein [Rhodohalobacter sp.]|uniref:hypothetical protein n=1 Tax=Rhodohalobacter sp. TaxID=1974210 RepID=UPI002ACE5F2E|nr:hypothetical protein [Rhodohalobacter sp.]MDZ7755954.1 hypothetical protein [Rhodohalobacter sp.]
MLIGSSFNSTLDSILLEAFQISEEKEIGRIEVEELNKSLRLDRREIKNYLEYLSDKNLIILSTIGGPFLYGHVELTSDGIKRAKLIQKKRNSAG